VSHAVPRLVIRVGRIVHPSTVEVAELRCHAGADHGNARDRGAPGVLCGPCFAAYLQLLTKLTRHA
jgi:hypothetical protein